MKLSKTFFAIMFGSTLAVLPAFAQEEPAHAQEFSVQALGSFVKSTNQNGVQQSATDSGGVLANYRFFFNATSGVEVNYGYQDSTQRYGAGGAIAGVGTYSHELSAAYVFRRRFKRVSPFALAGAGALIFDPQSFADASSQARPAFVYGAGADINLSRHWFMRAEYRGFVYDSPGYGIPALNGEDRTTHRAEPSIGFGFRL